MLGRSTDTVTATTRSTSYDEHLSKNIWKFFVCTRVVQFVADIRELFDEIDVNGDGDLEWGEFTAYCANLGFVATKHKTIQTETRKVRAIVTFDGF